MLGLTACILMAVAVGPTATGGPPADRPFRGTTAASISISHDGRRLFAATPTDVTVFDLVTGRRVYKLTAVDGLPASRRRWHGDGLRDIAVAATADGKHLITASAWDDRVRVWEAVTGKPVRTVPLPDAVPKKAGGWFYSRRLRSVVGCPAARVLLVEADNGHLFTLDPATWALTYRFRVSSELESASADGTRLTVNDPQDSVCDDAYLCDGETGKYLAEFQAGSNYVAYQVLSADGKRLATVGDAMRRNARLRLWDVATTKPIRLADAPDDVFRYGQPAFTPDGRVLMIPVGRLAPSGNDPPLTAIARWDTTSGKRLQDIPGDGGEIHGLTVSPDGKLLLSTGADGVIRRFDAATGKPFVAED